MKNWKPMEKVGRMWLEPSSFSVDSYIKYTLEVGEAYTTAELKLSDCGRSIDWYFDMEDDGLVKLDRAIKALQEFRAAIVAAQKHLAKRPSK